MAPFPAAVCFAVAPAAPAKPPASSQQQAAAAAQNPVAEMIEQGQQQLREGQHEAAMQTFIAAAEKAPADVYARPLARQKLGIR